MRLLRHALCLLLFSVAIGAGAQGSGAAAQGAKARSPAQSAPVRMSEAEAISALRAELERRVAAAQFSGAVLVARAGAPIFQQAYGYADREEKAPNTLDTKFRFGSMAKMFTGVCIAQLVQAGKMRFEDPISRYLPDYPNKEVAAVTIHQLLTHTGGAGDIFGPEFDAHRLELKDHQDYIELYKLRGVEFTPGSKWKYSNYGMVLLGRIIEVVSGQSYYEYVRDHVFRPAGMSSTGSEPEESHVTALAVAYTRRPPDQLERPAPRTGPLRDASNTLPYRGTSAGGGYATVGDFLKFATALMSNELLDEHYTKLVTTPKVDTLNSRRKVHYGYGFFITETPDGITSIGHGGGAPGMNGSLSIFPDSGYVVVALANMDSPAALEVTQFIERRLPLK